MAILVVDDDAGLRRALRRVLVSQGFEVEVATGGDEALSRLREHTFDLVVLDVMMPGSDGIEVCERLRALGDRLPVLMLTARDAVRDRVTGLDAGADDYLLKPFANEELVARVRALLRRAGGDTDKLAFSDLELDLLTRDAWRGGRQIELSPIEFELLEFLLRNKNTAVTRDMIAREVWKEGTGTLTNTIDVYITLLRKKIERPDKRTLIHTVRGVGYALREP